MEGVTIDDGDVLYRRLFYENVYPPHSKKRPGEVNSTAFTDHGDPLQQVSVKLAKMITLEECVRNGRPGQGVATITVAAVKALGLRVRYTPENGTTAAHCDIEPPDGEVITMLQCRQMARAAKVLRAPTPPPKP